MSWDVTVHTSGVGVFYSSRDIFRRMFDRPSKIWWYKHPTEMINEDRCRVLTNLFDVFCFGFFNRNRKNNKMKIQYMGDRTWSPRRIADIWNIMNCRLQLLGGDIFYLRFFISHSRSSTLDLTSSRLCISIALESLFQFFMRKFSIEPERGLFSYRNFKKLPILPLSLS